MLFQVQIGNREWMAQNRLNVEQVVEDKIKGFEEKGNTVVLVAVDGKPLLLLLLLLLLLQMLCIIPSPRPSPPLRCAGGSTGHSGHSEA